MFETTVMPIETSIKHWITEYLVRWEEELAQYISLAKYLKQYS